MKRNHFILWRTGLMLAIVMVFLHCRAARGEEPADAPLNVVLLYSGDFLLPAAVIQDRAMRDAFTAGTRRSVNFYVETLHANNLSAIDFDTEFARFIRRKYQGQKIDLIITVGTSALNFLERHRSELWPETPAMFFSVNETEGLHRKIPGLTIKLDPIATLDFAVQLQPDAHRVVVVMGVSEADRYWLPDIQNHLLNHHPALSATYLTNQTVAELTEELKKLPADTIVLYTTLFVDVAGKRYVPRDVAARLGATSGVPIYGLYETMLDHGIVGGAIPSLEEHGRQAGELGLRIIAGEKPVASPVPPATAAIPMVDWRQLQRWNISESRLPPDSIVLFRPLTLWEQHKDYVIGGLCVFVGQTATIVALLVQRVRRRRAEATAREDQERMSLAAEAASLGIWVWDIPRNHFWMSERCKQLFGFAPDAEVNQEIIQARVHPDDRALREEAIQRSLAGPGRYDPQYRVQLPDGTVRWFAASGRVERDANGKAVRMMGVLIDITHRKQTELEIQLQREELAHLSRVTTLSELSNSLAHELNQPLAIILTNAQAAQRFLAQAPPNLDEARDILADIVSEDQRAGDVIRRLRALLKPGQSQQLSLSLNEIIEDVLRIARSDLIGRGITVRAELAGNVPQVLGDRIQLQQVLLNLILNAGDAMAANPPTHRHLIVTTARRDGLVRVSVSDNGCGLPPETEQIFEPFYTTKKDGLGLGLPICRSIVTAHHGRLWAEANSGPGATLYLELPAAESKAMLRQLVVEH